MVFTSKATDVNFGIRDKKNEGRWSRADSRAESLYGAEESTAGSTIQTEDNTDLCSQAGSVSSHVIKRISSHVEHTSILVTPRATYPANHLRVGALQPQATTLDGAPWKNYIQETEDENEDYDEEETKADWSRLNEDGLRPPSAVEGLRPPSAAASLRPPSAATLRPPSAAPSLRPPSAMMEEEAQVPPFREEQGSEGREIFSDEDLPPNVRKVSTKKTMSKSNVEKTKGRYQPKDNRTPSVGSLQQSSPLETVLDPLQPPSLQPTSNKPVYGHRQQKQQHISGSMFHTTRPQPLNSVVALSQAYNTISPSIGTESISNGIYDLQFSPKLAVSTVANTESQSVSSTQSRSEHSRTEHARHSQSRSDKRFTHSVHSRSTGSEHTPRRFLGSCTQLEAMHSRPVHAGSFEMTSHELAAIQYRMRVEKAENRTRRNVPGACLILSLVFVILVGIVGVFLTLKPGRASLSELGNDATTLKIQLELDDHPEETGWTVREDNGVVISEQRIGSYKGSEYMMATVTHYVPVQPGSRCSFALMDSGDNGISNGSYRVSVYTTSEVMLLDSDTGDFGPRVQFNLFIPNHASPFPSYEPAAVAFWKPLGNVLSQQEADDRGLPDYFGYKVSLSADGSVLAIGSPALDYDGNGIVKVYRRQTQTDSRTVVWTVLGQALRGSEVGDGFGASVALSQDGSVLVIGAEGRSASSVPTGYVQVYMWKPEAKSGQWVPKGSLLQGNNDTDDNRSFGSDVALSANGAFLVVGLSSRSSVFSSPGMPAARVFRFDNNRGVWVQDGDTIVASKGDRAIMKVVISADGTTIATGVVDGAGVVQAYTFTENGWDLLGEPIQGEQDGDSFGAALALSADGTTMVIGASQHFVRATSRGYVEAYKLTSSWNLFGSRLVGNGDRDHFGWDVSLSYAGDTLAVAALRGGATGKGFIRAYMVEDGDWMQKGPDVPGDVEMGHFCTSVAISGDGDTIASGATAFENTNTQGYVQAFESARR